MKKVLTLFLTMFFSIVPTVLLAGPMPQDVQQVVARSSDCPTWPSIADDLITWGKDVGWKRFWAPVVAVLLGIHFWRGGSLTIRGVGLKGKRDR